MHRPVAEPGLARPAAAVALRARRRGLGQAAWIGAVAVGGAAIALAILVAPEAALALMGATFLGTVAIVYPDRLARVAIGFLAFLLVGYAMVGRGFAYLGVPPVFLGEVGLALGLAAAAGSGRIRRVLRSPIAWLLLAYMAWGAARTLPYVGVHGVDALRDAVLWGYGVFVLITAALLLRTGAWDRLVESYRTWLPWLVLYLPFAYAVTELFEDRLPRLPVSGVPFPDLKPGDVAVHLAGAGAFLLIGLWASRGRSGRRWLEWIMWGSWLVGFALVASYNRGGMVSVAAAFLLIATLRPSWRWLKIGIAGAVFMASVVALDVEFTISERREVSARQLASNVASVVGYQPAGEELLETVEWRKRWWGDIVDYTVRGPYFWTGKGYGLNLAVSDGYAHGQDAVLRSPHNGHLNVLARSGVPGLALWALLHVVFAASLLRAYLRARRTGEEGWAAVDLWILAVWTAFMVNATFDVFFEGPQGGIWFWCVMGVGLTALELQREGREPPRGSEPA